MVAQRAIAKRTKETINRQRIYRKLTEGKGFAANEKQFLVELLDCKPIRAPPAQAVAAIGDQLKRENAARLVRLGLRRGDPHPFLRKRCKNARFRG